ncbi:WD40 repeat domain-containing protein [Streptomyces sp. NPDC050433]|uniref:WD40 repeat domain-containing protein n=1 Tax=Streptomyces sp. NPDC050433 TaxID=3365615 RepID=UPI0037A45FEA
MTTLGEMLKGPCSTSLWEQLCPLLEALDETELAAAATALRSWPPERRPMPDRWWDELLAGGTRPYHALAGTRRLGRLVDVEWARVPAEPDADRDEYEEANEAADEAADGDEPADGAAFPYGAIAVAAPSDLRRVVFGAVAEWHHNGGDVVGWSTVASAPLTMLLSGADYHDNPLDIQLSPDGATVAASVECRWHAWSSAGEPLWSLDPAEIWPDGEADDGGDGDDEGEGEEDDLVGIDVPVRFAFDADGRRVAVGRLRGGPVAVLDARTGKVLAPDPGGARWEGEGPVALDAAGRLLAHAHGSRLVVRDVDSGAVLADADTGLAAIHALTMAPDGTGLLAVGADGKDDPAVCSLSLLRQAASAPTLTAGELIRADRAPDGMIATDPMSVITARAVWTAKGPLAFMSSDDGDVLFGDDGRVLRLSSGPSIAAFTPDGRALITVGGAEQDEMDPIDVWFLDAMDPAADQAGRTLP